jgi:8-oxo-dGTP pyrophosphatase MutT (NUDIX family)
MIQKTGQNMVDDCRQRKLSAQKPEDMLKSGSVASMGLLKYFLKLSIIMIDKESMTMEIWDLYDEQGQKTGETWERSRAREIPEGRYHIVCDILIRHQDGEFLLTLRDPDKDVYPGCLEASAGGSALAGETPEEAARREMLEETGLTADKLELIGTTFKPQSRSVIYAFLATVKCEKDSVRLQQGETVDYQWVDTPVFFRMIQEESVLKIQYPRYKPYLDTLEQS